MHRRYNPLFCPTFAKSNALSQAVYDNAPSCHLQEPLVGQQSFAQLSGTHRSRYVAQWPPAEEFSAFIDLLSQGDSAAWQELLAIWSHRLYRYLCYSTHSEIDAQELLQSTFASIVPDIVPRSVTLRSNVDLTILIVATAYRLVARYQQQYGAPSLLEAGVLHPSEQMQEQFGEALDQLALPVQQLLLMRYAVGLSINELAAATGDCTQNIRLILSAAVRHFSLLYQP